jgi:hypothetical protein
MDAPVMSTHYLSLYADFQHELRFILLLPLVCCAEGSLKNGLVLTYIQALDRNGFVISGL